MGFICDVCDEGREGILFCFAHNAVMCEQCDVRCGLEALCPWDEYVVARGLPARSYLRADCGESVCSVLAM